MALRPSRPAGCAGKPDHERLPRRGIVPAGTHRGSNPHRENGAARLRSQAARIVADSRRGLECGAVVPTGIRGRFRSRNCRLTRARRGRTGFDEGTRSNDCMSGGPPSVNGGNKHKRQQRSGTGCLSHVLPDHACRAGKDVDKAGFAGGLPEPSVSLRDRFHAAIRRVDAARDRNREGRLRARIPATTRIRT